MCFVELQLILHQGQAFLHEDQCLHDHVHLPADFPQLRGVRRGRLPHWYLGHGRHQVFDVFATIRSQDTYKINIFGYTCINTKICFAIFFRQAGIRTRSSANVLPKKPDESYHWIGLMHLHYMLRLGTYPKFIYFDHLTWFLPWSCSSLADTEYRMDLLDAFSL